MPRPRNLTEQIIVRIPADLDAALKRDAEENGRTVAQSVRFHLTKALITVRDRSRSTTSVVESPQRM